MKALAFILVGVGAITTIGTVVALSKSKPATTGPAPDPTTLDPEQFTITPGTAPANTTSANPSEPLIPLEDIKRSLISASGFTDADQKDQYKKFLDQQPEAVVREIARQMKSGEIKSTAEIFTPPPSKNILVMRIADRTSNVFTKQSVTSSLYKLSYDELLVKAKSLNII